MMDLKGEQVKLGGGEEGLKKKGGKSHLRRDQLKDTSLTPYQMGRKPIRKKPVI